jgi:ATP synthase F1 delta subunit
MRDRKVAGRYAEALLRTAKPAGTLVACAESYAGVLEVMAASRELVIFLDSPQVREQEKKEVLKKVFGPHLEPVLLDFFNLLLDRNRIELLRDIGTVFAELVEMAGELVEFPGEVYGMAMNLEEDNVGVVIFGGETTVKEGDTVKRTRRIMEIPVGRALLGRVVNPLGQPIDGGAPSRPPRSAPSSARPRV